METNKHKDQNQGKQSTAKTDKTYDRNAEELKNSATTSQNSATSPSKPGAGGVMRDEGQDAGTTAKGKNENDKT